MSRIVLAVWPPLAATIAACAMALAAEPSQPASTSTSSSPSADQSTREARGDSLTKAENNVDLATLRLREGTRLRDVAGRFRQSGDSLTFLDAEDREISGLPNLNLERILRMLKTVEEPESITWSVSGAITEFSGRNYLLISRAVYKAAAPPPAPESLAEPEPLQKAQ
jgi:hypothetical protein